ncbi:MAG: dTMP kinase, partial [Chloroflexi bacterium]|nr:dTMP kinase [Chloroflexota bacterium]
REAHLTKEPSDGPAGAIIRLILAGRLVGRYDELRSSFDARTLALLFAADRFDHLSNDVVPKLNSGITVISDRYYLSSFAYQGSDIGDMEWLEAINSECLTPDLTVFLDVDPAISYKRMQRQRWHVELFETPSKMIDVHRSYLSAIRRLEMRGENVVIVDGNQPIRDVHRDVMAEVKKILSRNRVTPAPQLSFQEAAQQASEEES